MELLNKAEAYIFNLFKDKLSCEYMYHDYLHTLRVVTALNELIKGENIAKNDALHLRLAGWFHDAGYIFGGQNHEQRSCEIFVDFLKSYPNENIDTEEVSRLILATQFQHEPTDLLEMCMKDADYFHFTLDNYGQHCGLLKAEVEGVKKTEITEEEWNRENLLMLTKNHYFYTNYAKEHWQEKKEQTIFKIRGNLQKIADKKAKENKPKKSDRPDRGVETLFRVTLRNHTQLSAIADSKANILLSVNSIIISIILTAIIPKLDSPSNAHLIIPTFTLLIFSVATIVITILATKPKVSSNPITKADIQSRKANILFFGNFHQLAMEDFNEAMNDLMKDRDYLYDTLIKDLYSLGVVLNKKYKLLGISYTVFMIGIIVSVTAFSIAFMRI